MDEDEVIYEIRRLIENSPLKMTESVDWEGEYEDYKATVNEKYNLTDAIVSLIRKIDK